MDLPVENTLSRVLAAAKKRLIKCMVHILFRIVRARPPLQPRKTLALFFYSFLNILRQTASEQLDQAHVLENGFGVAGNGNLFQVDYGRARNRVPEDRLDYRERHPGPDHFDGARVAQNVRM